jgi:cardiolipin synthase A/B
MMPSPESAPPDRVVIAPPDRRPAVLDIIRGAQSRLSLSLFRCNDKEVFRELKAAVARGVDVEVLVTSRAKGGRRKLRKLWQRLENTGATVYAYNDPVVKYHAKYVVADDGPAVVASLNFTRKCFTRTCDALVITFDADVVSGLRQLMAADRDGIAAPSSLSRRIILGPEGARRQFMGLIADAQTSILMIDAKVADPEMIALLDERRHAGVDVLVHDRNRIGTLRSHGKIMLIDGVRAVVGSLALTALSLDFRREVAIEITEPAAVEEIKALFTSLGMIAGAQSDAVPAAAGETPC